MVKIKTLILCSFILLTLLLPLITLIQPELSLISNPRFKLKIKINPPISINGNGELNNTADSGYGNITHPYIIENKTINGGGATGILIKNTDSFFIIRNCTIYNMGQKELD
ncbi:MAG: hypothetical protein ACTSX4_03290 [Candidatus Helarchaeota archaeon]